ncbi:MAG TPA: hypothetical protein VEF76_13375 [Patescibacteria group bacterium]|nr:hypothetical protein [Patescibacteria group bacterium]
MRKNSDIAAGKVGKFVIGLGFIAAALSPVAGAVLGGWSTGAAVLASWGLGAAAPLAAAGAFGGMLLGFAAMPFVAIGSVALGGLAAITTKAVGSTIEWMFSGGKDPAAVPATDVQRQVQIDPAGSKLNKLKLRGTFDTALLRRIVETRPAPQLKMLPRPSF